MPPNNAFLYSQSHPTRARPAKRWRFSLLLDTRSQQAPDQHLRPARCARGCTLEPHAPFTSVDPYLHHTRRYPFTPRPCPGFPAPAGKPDLMCMFVTDCSQGDAASPQNSSTHNSRIPDRLCRRPRAPGAPRWKKAVPHPSTDRAMQSMIPWKRLALSDCHP